MLMQAGGNFVGVFAAVLQQPAGITVACEFFVKTKNPVWTRIRWRAWTAVARHTRVISRSLRKGIFDPVSCLTYRFNFSSAGMMATHSPSQFYPLFRWITFSVARGARGFFWSVLLV